MVRISHLLSQNISKPSLKTPLDVYLSFSLLLYFYKIKSTYRVTLRRFVLSKHTGGDDAGFQAHPGSG